MLSTFPTSHQKLILFISIHDPNASWENDLPNWFIKLGKQDLSAAIL